MTKSILFATGNERKLREARYMCEKYDLDLQVVANDAEEIQHMEPAEVTKAKAYSVHQAIGRPVLVQDTSWSVPVLGGFPGAYMKDISSWLSSEDWLQIMRRHDDRTILQHEHMAYHDGHKIHHFEVTYRGRFIEEPRGQGIGLSSDRVIMMGDSAFTLAEALDNGAVSSQGEAGMEHWRVFIDWFMKH